MSSRCLEVLQTFSFISFNIVVAMRRCWSINLDYGTEPELKIITAAEYDSELSEDMFPRSSVPCLLPHIRKIRLVKVFFLISCITFAFFFLWIQNINTPNDPPVTERLIQEALENVAKDSRYSDVYRKTSRLPKDLKYLLLWTRSDYAPFYNFKSGQRAFLKNNCSVINCYVTTSRKFFGNNLSRFDAIAFNGRNLDPYDLPYNRSQHQKYIYFNTESADYYPICDKIFDGFFNWTSTYRLDSDIPYTYILIRNSKGEVVGPKLQMTWFKDMQDVNEDFADRLVNKSKAAAWFVSHCKTKSHRTDFVTKLQDALAKYRYTVDVYGACGTLKCPKEKKSACDALLSRDYYFYMSLENSFAEDYVTEKLLTALKQDIVPIIYGGANYSRFLPPGSYLDGRRYSAEELAAIINRLIHSTTDYLSFFKWKSYYTYHSPERVENICSVCEALNNQDMMDKETVYNDFRRWWHPNYKEIC